MAGPVGLRRVAGLLGQVAALSLRRGASSHVARRQHFKKHVFNLHVADPDRWTDRALSREFGIELPRIQALLALERIEAESGILDPELVELAEAIEDYLVPDDDEADANARAQLAEMSEEVAAEAPDPGLHFLSEEQQQTLVRAVLDRFGVSESESRASAEATLDKGFTSLFGALSAEQLQQLSDALHPLSDEARAGGVQAIASERKERMAQAEAAEAAEAAEGGGLSERGLLEQLLEAELPEALRALSTEGELDLAALPAGALPGLPEDILEVHAEAEAAEPATATAAQEGENTIDMGVFSANPRGMPKFLVINDKGDMPDMYVSKRLMDKMRKVRREDEADLLQFKIEKRHSNLYADKTLQYRNTGTFVFTDITRTKNDRAAAPRRVWVSMKGDVPREPTAEETKSATLRVMPPQLVSRTKRNW